VTPPPDSDVDPDGPPRRVSVTSPRTSAARTRRIPPTSEIDSQSRLGEIYLSSLVRAQMRLAAGVLAVVLTVVAGLPLVFRAFPGLTRTSVLNMPLPWVLLAFAVYPFLFLCGWVYVHRAEHNESVFETMVNPPGRPSEDGGG
jgi:hypothetical protein